jgi:hypothetical protein
MNTSTAKPMPCHGCGGEVGLEFWYLYGEGPTLLFCSQACLQLHCARIAASEPRQAGK